MPFYMEAYVCPFFLTLDNHTHKNWDKQIFAWKYTTKTCACNTFDECYYARIMNHVAREHEQQDHNNYMLLFQSETNIHIEHGLTSLANVYIHT